MKPREYDIDIRADLFELAQLSEGDGDGRFTYLAIRSSSGYDEEPSVHSVQFDYDEDTAPWSAYGEAIGKQLRAGIDELLEQDAFWMEMDAYYEHNKHENTDNSFVGVEVWLKSPEPFLGDPGPSWVVEVSFVTEIGTTPKYFAGWVFTQGP